MKNVSRNYAGNQEEVNEDSVRKYKSGTKIVELKCAKLWYNQTNFPNFFIIIKSLFFKTANSALIVSQRGLTHTFREIVHF